MNGRSGEHPSQLEDLEDLEVLNILEVLDKLITLNKRYL